MHARNEKRLLEVTPSANPLASLIAVLRDGDGSEAVRHLQWAIDHHAVSSEELIEALNTCGESGLLAKLVLALANAPCPHCRNGFDACAPCRGGGRGEDRGQACAECGGTGIAACDFCGGSGLITYDAVPEPLRASVAMRRVRSAGERVADEDRQPLPQSVSREQLPAVRKDIMKRALRVRRDLAILANAAQFARSLRDAYPDTRAMTGQLFQHASKTAKIGQQTASRLLAILGRICRACASGSAETPGGAGFEMERAEKFESQSREFARASRRRAALFPGHSGD